MYLLYIILLIILILLGILYWSRPRRVNCTCQDVVFYKKGFIAASGRFIMGPKGKKHNVQENIICTRLVNGDLITLDTTGTLVYRNPKNLKILDQQKLPGDIKHPMWFDWHKDQWWVGDGKLILTLDANMKPLGYWKAPVPIEKAVWYKDYLYALTKRGLEVLKIADNAEFAKIVKHVDLTCTGFDIQNKQILCADGLGVTTYEF